MATEPKDTPAIDTYADDAEKARFEYAKSLAVESADRDAKTASIGATDTEELKANGNAPREIPARPEVSKTTNPEGVLVEETADEAATDTPAEEAAKAESSTDSAA